MMSLASLDRRTARRVYCSLLLLFSFFLKEQQEVRGDLRWQRGEGFQFVDTQPRPERGTPKAGFTQVDARTAGITFSNGLPVQMMMENQNLMLGSGVAAGDFDGDGLCDL